MNLNNDIEKRCQEKLASVTDQIRSMYDSMVGNQGNLSAGGYGMGGAALGGLAGSRFGTPGALMGAGIGGMMGYGGANAINTQGQMDQGNDLALMGGMGQGLAVGDQIDQQQNQEIGSQGQMISQIMNYLTGGGAQQPAMGPGAGSMESTDPSMNGIGMGNVNQGDAISGKGPNQKMSSVTMDKLAEAIAKRLVHGV